MLKRFLHGLAFGFGLAVSLLATFWGYEEFLSEGPELVFSENQSVVSAPPPLESDSARFLGSTGRYDGSFSDNRSSVLAAGDGRIVGSISAGGNPAADVKIRLALNSKVMSQWALTDNEGVYEISVPSGDYRIQGYELDYVSAGKRLGGYIDHPANIYSTGAFVVSPESAAEGIHLKYVSPVSKHAMPNKIDLDELPILSWDEYPGAARYRIHLYSSEGPGDYNSREQVFEWRNAPLLNTTEFALNEIGEKLKSGRYYSFKVYALNSQDRPISETHEDYGGYDFRIE